MVKSHFQWSRELTAKFYYPIQYPNDIFIGLVTTRSDGIGGVDTPFCVNLTTELFYWFNGDIVAYLAMVLGY